MTSKSTITKRTISRKKKWLKQLNNPSKNKQNVRERERERERERVSAFLSWTTWKEYVRDVEMK